MDAVSYWKESTDRLGTDTQLWFQVTQLPSRETFCCWEKSTVPHVHDYLAYLVSIAATRMYRGLSDYLGRIDHLHSTNVIPDSDGQSNTTPFGKFIAQVPPDVSITSGGRMQIGDQVSIRGSLTFASANNAAVENLKEAAGGGDEAV